MPRYLVNHNYRSGTFGPWVAGDRVTLDDAADAEFVNRDSPGALTEIDPEVEAAKKRAETERRMAGTKAAKPPAKAS